MSDAQETFSNSVHDLTTDCYLLMDRLSKIHDMEILAEKEGHTLSPEVAEERDAAINALYWVSKARRYLRGISASLRNEGTQSSFPVVKMHPSPPAPEKGG